MRIRPPTLQGPWPTGNAGQLLWPTLRTMPWWQLSAGGGLCLGVVLLSVGSAELAPYEVVERVRLASVLLAVGVAGLLDDPARPHLDSTPVPLAVRQALRLGAGLAIVGLWWTVTLAAAIHHPLLAGVDRSGTLPIAGLTTSLAAFVLVTLAVAACVTRTRGGSGAIPAAAAAVVVPVTAVLGPRLLAQWTAIELTMFPSLPGAGSIDAATSEQLWRAAHQRWLLIAGVASLVLLWALQGSYARPALRRRQRRSQAPVGVNQALVRSQGGERR